MRIATGGLLPGSGPRPGGKPASRTATIGVVGVEHAGARGDRVVLTRPASAAATRPQGQDLRAGSTYLSAGSLLHSASVGLAAAMGHGSLPVSRRPRVAIVTTGDEVVAPGAAILPGQLFDANAAALSAAARKAGCEVVGSRYVRDEAAQLSAVLAELGEQQQRPDLVITTGGVSRGEHDIVRDVLLADDRLVFWRVAVRPAGPTLFGDFAGLPVLGLPGNPVSSLVGFLLFGRAFIDTALGSSATLPYFDRFTVRLADDFRPQAKTVFHRAHLRVRDGVIEATAFDNQSSGVLRSLVEADALVMTPPNREGPRSPTSGARGATASGQAIDLRRHL